MNAAHVHLLLNHIPIIGLLVGIILLIYSIRVHSSDVQNVALSIFIACGVLALPAYFSGEGAEEIIEHLPGVDHALIHEHEEQAFPAFIMMCMLTLFSIAYFLPSIRKYIRVYVLLRVILIISIITYALMLVAAYHGGKIRHPEIQQLPQSTSSAKQNVSNVMDKQTAEHYIWGENCDSWVFVDTDGLSVKQEHMPRGTREKLHLHTKAQQFFFITKGTATFYLNDEKKIVHAQTGILIHPQTKHYIANETTDSLEFLVISQPTTKNDRTTF